MRTIEIFKLWGKILIDNEEALKSISSTGKKFEEVGQKFEKVGKTLTTKVTLPIMAIGGVIGKLGMDFESEMSKVQAISGATGDDLEKLKEKAKEMGANTKFSASESAQALTYMSMAGWKTGEMLGGLEGVMSLAAASGEDLALVSDIVTDALTGFGMKAEQAGEFADLLASASSNSNTNVSMMGETFKYVAPLFGSLGYSAEDAALATGLMANAGIKAGQAGTSLRSAITNLISPSKEAAGWIEQLGIETTDAEGQMIPFSDVMVQLREKFAGLSEEQQTQAASSMFGKQAMSGMLAIINASEEDFNKLTEATTNYNGAANEMANIMEDNLSGRITKLKSALEGVALQLYEHLIPYFEKLVEWVQKGVDWFASLDEGTQEMIVKIAMLAAAIGPLLILGGKIGQGIGGLMQGFKSLGFLFSPQGLIILGIMAVIAAGALLIKNWDKVKETAIEIKDKITETFNNLVAGTVQWGEDIVTGLWDGIVGAKDWIVGKITGFASDIAGGFKKFFGIASPSKLMAEFGQYMVEGLDEGIKKNQNKVTDTVDNFMKKVDNAFSKIQQTVKTTVEVQKQKHELVTQEIGIAEKAMTDIIAKYGEGSMEALNYKEKLLDLQIEHSKLTGEIEKTTQALSKQAEVQLEVSGGSYTLTTSKGSIKYDLGSQNALARDRKSKDLDKYGDEINALANKYGVDMGVAYDMFKQNELDEIYGREKSYGVTQNITVNSPTPLTPSEVARQVKNASIALALGIP